MNKLYIGLADKTFDTRPGYLLIDDGPICDAFLAKHKRAKEFDPRKHSFNPLPMTVRNAREFASIVFGEAGADTLRVRDGKRALTRLLTKANRLDRLNAGRADDEKEAAAIIDDLLLSPVLRGVLCNQTPRWLFSGSLVARINRADLGDHDARILGSLLILQFKGQIIVPDFGFYARDFHASLLRENRLIAGVYTLSELEPKLRQLCLLMEKEGRRCTYDDAQTLAHYAGLAPHTVGYDDYLKDLMQ